MTRSHEQRVCVCGQEVPINKVTITDVGQRQCLERRPLFDDQLKDHSLIFS